MKRLILITDHYPYTRGELPFVQPELAVTCQHFEVSVICKSPAGVSASSWCEIVSLS